MINEAEPVYFSRFREHIDKRFDGVGERIDALDKKIEKEIESLAISTANEFRRIDKRFDEIDERFEKIDERFDKMDIRFEEMDKRFDRVDDELVVIDDRLYRIEDDIKGLNKSYGKMEKHVGRYEVRASNIEEILNQDLSPRVLALEKLA